MDSGHSDKPKWGISKVIKLTKNKQSKSLDLQKKDEFNNPKFQDATIVKVEHTSYNCIILLCMIHFLTIIINKYKRMEKCSVKERNQKPVEF